jgi:hypothetical protein
MNWPPIAAANWPPIAFLVSLALACKNGSTTMSRMYMDTGTIDIGRIRVNAENVDEFDYVYESYDKIT